MCSVTLSPRQLGKYLLLICKTLIYLLFLRNSMWEKSRNMWRYSFHSLRCTFSRLYSTAGIEGLIKESHDLNLYGYKKILKGNSTIRRRLMTHPGWSEWLTQEELGSHACSCLWCYGHNLYLLSRKEEPPPPPLKNF